MLNDILIIVMFGLGAGAVTAGGYFAVVTSVGVVTRFAQYTNTADRKAQTGIMAVKRDYVRSLLWIVRLGRSRQQRLD